MRASQGSPGRSPSRRRLRPVVEHCEDRQLLSGLGAALTAKLSARAARLDAPPSPPAFVFNERIDPESNRVLNPVGTPTPRQAHRMAFAAGFNGAYQAGPGRFSLESMQIFLHGKGGSTAFLHGDMQLRISVPVEPDVPPTGILMMFDKNRSSGGELGLDLTADPNSIDRFGRPTRFSYTVDDNLSGGTFAAGLGEGTVQIRYGHSQTGGRYMKGPATVVVRGQVYSSGTSGPLIGFTLDP